MTPFPVSPSRRAPLSLWGLVEVVGLLLCAATLVGFLARWWWVFELTTHFRLHLAAALAVLTLLWAAKRHRRWLIICGSLAAVNAGLVLQVYWPVETTLVPSGVSLRAVCFNVHTENERMAEALQFLQTTDADVIVLLEVNDAWVAALQPLRARYPQVIAEPREDNFGVALFSRLPLTNSEVIELDQGTVPSIATTVQVAGQSVALLGTHPLPPGSAKYARRRNEQLLRIAAWARRQSLPTVVLGDLNCTPWSPYFTTLLRDGGLKNVAPQRGLYGSWLAKLPFGRIPIDHGLVSPTIQVVSKQVGPPVGSDHLPLLLDLRIPTAVGTRMALRQ